MPVNGLNQLHLNLNAILAMTEYMNGMALLPTFSAISFSPGIQPDACLLCILLLGDGMLPNRLK